ncbi:type I-E CRISPR-associated protein Cse2/CasB [Alloalcanivorax gelatiniphagus]|uniref:Type I-E CRISPR-associated protein Cse2/CasB n=1 Tax=Alloalcanivorax gelatiniphagus TaxID=1194167 RepID=A0ABY2XP44_9GAMM|nr:type I-E CRISPR-associated protein Cse2/CasB [Alloalcanivorax gelatiniphagus]TMW14253.1 type I-E CRISPR-associated protein Cse2/CasB [Alloalcanivorax gelatiniphagus]
MSDTELENAQKKDARIERCHVLSGHEAWAVRDWWQRLTLSPEMLKKLGSRPGWSKGVRAELRRCDRPEAALLTEGFRHLWDGLGRDEIAKDALYVWAGVAMVLAELKGEQAGVSLATKAGKAKGDAKKQGDSKQPRMSELRFQQLMECHSFEELLMRLRRALALVDKEGVSAVSLADDILQWWKENESPWRPERPTQGVAFRWANDYFRQVAGYRSNND